MLEGHTGDAWRVALSADGTRAVSASEDRTLRVWDLTGHNPPVVLEGHTERVWHVALSADGTRAVSASWDGTLRVWGLIANGSGAPAQVACFSNDSATGFTALAISTTHIVAGDTLGRLHLLQRHQTDWTARSRVAASHPD